MKQVILILCAAMLMTACKNEEKKSPENPAILSNQPADQVLKDSANFTTIQWIDSTHKDIGKIKKGQKVEVTYKFMNTGDKPLIINSVMPGCGCTVAEKPEKPIMPGKEDKIVAMFNTENQGVGSQMKHINVSANTKPTTEHQLTFAGEVVQ